LIQQQIGKQGLFSLVIERCHNLIIASELKVTEKLDPGYWHSD
jgi:hypothetical protein